MKINSDISLKPYSKSTINHLKKLFNWVHFNKQAINKSCQQLFIKKSAPEFQEADFFYEFV